MADIAPLRRRLTLETRIDAPDLGGGWDRSWTPLGVHYGAIRAVSGAEAYAGSRQAQTVTHRITLRASALGSSARPRADQRFRAGPRVFSIKAVFERDGRGRQLTCLCEETRA